MPTNNVNALLEQRGRPIAPPLASISDLLGQLAAVFSKGVKLGGAQDITSRSHLTAVLSMAQQALKNREIDAKAKAAAAALNDPKAAAALAAKKASDDAAVKAKAAADASAALQAAQTAQLQRNAELAEAALAQQKLDEAESQKIAEAAALAQQSLGAGSQGSAGS